MTPVRPVAPEPTAPGLPPILQRHVDRSAVLPGIKLPLVSVIITNHNYADYVTQAIRSVAHQTYRNLECVIVDDRSSDRSLERIHECLDEMKDGRFRLVETPRNMGQFGATAVGLEQTTGPFVAMLDADDVYFPQFVEEHVAAHVNEHWSAAVTASDSCQIDRGGAVIEGTQWHLKRPKVKFEAPERVWGGVVLYPYPVEGEDVAPVDGGEPRRIFQLPAEYFGYHAATMSCLMFRRSFLELTKIQTEERVCADYYYYVLAHALSGTIIIPRPLTYYRVHGSNNFFTRSILGGQAGPPENLEAINRRLEHMMLDKALADEAKFLAYPTERYYDLVRNLVTKKRAWRYGKHSRTVRLAFGHKRMITFALTYHPVLRHTLIRKLLKKRR